MKQLWTLVVAMSVVAFPAYASEGHEEGGHGDSHGEPKDKASESSEFILHHVADDTEFQFELPFVHLPAIHISELFGKEPGQGLYLEREPGDPPDMQEDARAALEAALTQPNGGQRDD